MWRGASASASPSLARDVGEFCLPQLFSPDFNGRREPCKQMNTFNDVATVLCQPEGCWFESSPGVRMPRLGGVSRVVGQCILPSE
jgi:hypothetical protein